MKIATFLIFSLFVFYHQALDRNTDSLSTKAHLEFMRDVKLPFKLERLSNKLGVWKELLGPNWKTHPNWPVFQTYFQDLEKEQEATIILLNSPKESGQMMEKTKVEMKFRSSLRPTIS